MSNTGFPGESLPEEIARIGSEVQSRTDRGMDVDDQKAHLKQLKAEQANAQRGKK